MRITPAKIKRITSNNADVSYRQLFGNGFGLQYTLTRPLINALRTGTGTPEFRSGVAADTVVGPGDAQAGIPFLVDFSGLNRRASSFSRFHHFFLPVAFLSLLILSCRTNRSGYCIRGDLEVRSIPGNLPIAKHDYLRRFVRDTQTVLDRA